MKTTNAVYSYLGYYIAWSHSWPARFVALIDQTGTQEWTEKLSKAQPVSAPDLPLYPVGNSHTD